MRGFVLVALSGIAFSRLLFGSVVPPSLHLHAPGSTVGKDRAIGKNSGWPATPAHSIPAWLKHPVHREYSWMKPRDDALGESCSHRR